MKKIILTFLVLILILVFIKRKSFFNAGCTIGNLGNPQENDFYNCFLNDINRYNSQYKNNWNQGIQKVRTHLGEKIKNYFASLYSYGLETEYRLIIAFIPAAYNSRGIRVISDPNIKIKHFLNAGHQQGRYQLRNMRNNNQRLRNMMRSVNYRGDIYQYHGFLVGMGFKIALSNPKNNLNGSRCSRYQRRPDSSTGICIPHNFYDFNAYFRGGRYYDHNEIYNRFRSPRYSGSMGKYYSRRSVFRRGWRDMNANPYEGNQKPRREQKGPLYHKSGSVVRSCYLKSKRHCRSAYGDQSLGTIVATIDPGFFNKFFNPNSMTTIRNQFKSKNFKELNGYF